MVLQASFLDPTLTEIGSHDRFLPATKRGLDMPRLTNYGTLDRDNSTEALDDVVGLELEISSVEVRNGNFGEYVRFQATDGRGREHTVSTGAFLVVDALKDAAEKGALPLNARFFKKGRTYRFE